PGSEWRLEGDEVVIPRVGAPLLNALTGWSRGFDVLVQRRSANGVSGWIAYSYGQARRHDAQEGLEFDADFDQRHTVTAYASARLSETLNLSVKYRYGSGFPLPGFIQVGAGGATFLSEQRNEYRPDAYGRLDLRANKAWLFRGWKLTLFGEVLNVLGRENARYFFDRIEFRTARVFVSSDGLFPRL